jgi:hypothetical protein
VRAVVVEGLDLGALETLGARANRLPAPVPDSVEGLLCRHLGLSRPAGADWPLAPVCLQAEGEAPGTGWWLRLDPVHLAAGMSDLQLREAADFPLEMEEARALADALEEHFAADGWRLVVPAPCRWYLRLEGASRIRTRPPSSVAGRPLRDALPEGEDAAFWRARLNEAQMVLHASPVNAAREARGVPTVNAVWAWGGGRLEAAAPSSWAAVWADHHTARALAGHATTPNAALPAHAREWLAQAGPGSHLLARTEGAGYVATADLEGWREWIADLEADWMRPLLAALRHGELASLVLDPGDGSVLRVTRWALLRVWRRGGLGAARIESTRPWWAVARRLP